MFYYFVASFIIIDSICFITYTYKKCDCSYLLDLYFSLENLKIIKFLDNIINFRTQYNLYKINSVADKLAECQFKRMDNITKNPFKIYNNNSCENTYNYRLSKIDKAV